MPKSRWIMESVVLFGAGFIGGAFFSCSPSILSNMWRDPAYDSEPMGKIFVIAVEGNKMMRKWWEDDFANQLAQYGVAATPSHQLFPDELPDTNRVIDDSRLAYDGVLIVSKLAPDTTTTYVPGYVAIVPVPENGRWDEAYHTRYHAEYYPGHAEASTSVRHQVDVWSTKEGGRLIWTGTGEVVTPASSKAVDEAIVRSVVPELERQRIIGKAK